MLTTVYVNGCSWTDGDTFDTSGLLDKLGLPKPGKQYAYPKLVSDHYGLKLVDESRYGGSLNRVVRMTWEYIATQADVSNTLFILEIPNGFRDEIYSSEYDTYINVTSGNLSGAQDITEMDTVWKKTKKDIFRYYERFWDYGKFRFKEYINFMSLINFLKQRTNNIFIIQYDEIFSHEYVKFGNNLLDKDNLIKLTHPSFGKGKVYDNIWHMSESEKISIGDVMGITDTHLNIDGHVILSEIIIKHLNKIKDVKEYIKIKDREKIQAEKNLKKEKMLIEKMKIKQLLEEEKRKEEMLLAEKKRKEEIIKSKKLI
jgi:hypothetical protein